MPEYIDIKDIPVGMKQKYPWAEWEATPEGKALEVTKFLNGRTPQSFCAGNAGMAEKRGLKLSYRGERVYVRREKQP